MQQINPGPLTYVFIVRDTPGVSLPPKGWGAVESLVCDYKTYLEELGHKAVIIRDANLRKVIDQVNECRPDVVHSHWKHSMQIMRRINAPLKILTAHSGWGPEAALRGFSFHFNHLSQYLVDGWVWAVLSPAWEKTMLDFGYHPAEIFVAPNGADHRRYRFRKTPLHADRSLWLGRIQPRKRPHAFQAIDSLDFVGPLSDELAEFDETRKNYLGEWTRDTLYEHLSDYANLVLLSKSEGAPLAVPEALICGLGVVVSAGAAANLDMRLPWISVIPEEKITDTAFVEAEIARNRETALCHRERIREYGIENFSWEKLVPRYADLCRKIYDGKIARQGFLARRADTCRRLCRVLPTLHRFTARNLLRASLHLVKSPPPPPPPRS